MANLVPKDQNHVLYLSFKNYHGQYLAIAIAGSSDWNMQALNVIEMRSWLVNTS